MIRICNIKYWSPRVQAYLGWQGYIYGDNLQLQEDKKYNMYKNIYILNKYKTFSVLIYSYINTSGNWENDHCLSSSRARSGKSLGTRLFLNILKQGA
jgi:hypothetical protein